jgi:hypothetical protein
MTKICRWLVNFVSGMLEPAERDVVRGDLVEAGVTGARALRDVLGLVARRQAALWTGWRPWLALIGLVAPFGILLTLNSRHVADASAVPLWLYLNNWEMAHLTNAGFRLDLAQNFAHIAMECLTLLCSSLAVGFVLGTVSRRAIWVNGALFCMVLLLGELPAIPQSRYHTAVFALPFYKTIFPWIIQTVLVLVPSLWGMYFGKEKNT